MSEITVTKQTEHEAMIAAWDANCLHDKRLGLLIAPGYFTVTQDIVLAGGAEVKRGTRFFDWYTAMALSDEGKFGNGWRLPTLEEAKCLKNKVHLLCHPIRYGYIGANDMIVCRCTPEMATKRILNPNSNLLWTSTSKNDVYAYFAEFFGSGTFRADASMCKSFGLSILCVKDA